MVAVHAILKFKLSTITGPLLHISPYAAKMPFIVIKQQILILKTTVLNTLVTMTMTSDIENSKKRIIISSHVNFLFHTSQY